MARGEGGVKRFSLYFLHYVRHTIIATIGYGGSEVGYLEGREVYLTLPYRDRDDGESVPRTFIVGVIVIAVRDESALLAWEVDARLIAEAHRDHIVAPAVHGIERGAVFGTVAYHIV